MVELTKWFKKDKDDDDVGIVFHKDLVEDIAKLRFPMKKPQPQTLHIEG